MRRTAIGAYRGDDIEVERVRKLLDVGLVIDRWQVRCSAKVLLAGKFCEQRKLRRNDGEKADKRGEKQQRGDWAHFVGRESKVPRRFPRNEIATF